MIWDVIYSLMNILDGSIGSRLRYLWLSGRLRRCGGYFTTGSQFRLMGCDKIEIGKNCSFNHNVLIGANEGIRFGDYVMVGPNCIFRDANHGYADSARPMKLQKNITAPIEIGSDVWIGSNCVILKGSKVGNGSIIAAHSLVNAKCRIGEYEVWGGIPAKFLKTRCMK